MAACSTKHMSLVGIHASLGPSESPTRVWHAGSAVGQYWATCYAIVLATLNLIKTDSADVSQRLMLLEFLIDLAIHKLHNRSVFDIILVEFSLEHMRIIGVLQKQNCWVLTSSMVMLLMINPERIAVTKAKQQLISCYTLLPGYLIHGGESTDDIFHLELPIEQLTALSGNNLMGGNILMCYTTDVVEPSQQVKPSQQGLHIAGIQHNGNMFHLFCWLIVLPAIHVSAHHTSTTSDQARSLQSCSPSYKMPSILSLCRVVNSKQWCFTGLWEPPWPPPVCKCLQGWVTAIVVNKKCRERMIKMLRKPTIPEVMTDHVLVIELTLAIGGLELQLIQFYPKAFMSHNTRVLSKEHITASSGTNLKEMQSSGRYSVSATSFGWTIPWPALHGSTSHTVSVLLRDASSPIFILLLYCMVINDLG